MITFVLCVMFFLMGVICNDVYELSSLLREEKQFGFITVNRTKYIKKENK